MAKLIYNNNNENFDECLWVLLEDDVEYPFNYLSNADQFDKDGYRYEFFTTDIIICEYE